MFGLKKSTETGQDERQNQWFENLLMSFLAGITIIVKGQTSCCWPFASGTKFALTAQRRKRVGAGERIVIFNRGWSILSCWASCIAWIFLWKWTEIRIWHVGTRRTTSSSSTRWYPYASTQCSCEHTAGKHVTCGNERRGCPLAYVAIECRSWKKS